jgi:hypothetical protein
MSKRRLFLFAGLAAAVGIPVSISESGRVVDKAGEVIRSLTASEPAANIPGPAADPSPAGISRPDGPQARLDGLPAQDLAEVLRFDVTPGWIMSRWARVTTTAGGVDRFQGYRVPLVTGNRETDLAGALTYYFNHKPEVQRIRFVGSTGDPSRLVALVTERFGFAPQRSTVPGEYLYQIQWNGKPNSELRIRMAEVVRANEPSRRFDIELEINLPDVPPSTKPSPAS